MTSMWKELKTDVYMWFDSLKPTYIPLEDDICELVSIVEKYLEEYKCQK